MRHNKWNKYLKIACSWILIFSMCFLSLNTVNASAEDTTAFESESETGDTEAFTSDTEIESEPSTDQFTSESEETKQETEKQIPDSIEVEQLNAEIQNRVANGEVPSTDRVKYVDEDGKTIEGAPTTIELGKISDHTEITIADKNYEFKNAKVSDEDCVFIGQYENYIYYSTDGNIAKKLTDEQLLVMTYSESKNSVNEEIEQVATEDTNKSEESTEQIIDNEGGTEQPEELNVPESISVQSLDEALQISVANGDENATSTDRVEYVDVNGNSIAGAPSVIQFGAIADHKDLSIEGRHFEFKSAKVDGKNCVYIGKYNDTIYYSTDGVIAIKMDDTQNLTMMYQEYYLVSIKEVIPDSCTPGTITKKNGSLDAPLDISNQIRVNAGENFIIYPIEKIHAQTFGIKISTGKNRQFEIVFCKEKQCCFVDRTTAGVNPHDKFAGKYKAPVDFTQEFLTIKLLMDVSQSELFINNREVVMSNLLFPEDFYKVKLFATGGDLVIEKSIIYEMDEIMNHPLDGT